MLHAETAPCGPFSSKCIDKRDYPLPTSIYIQFSPTQTTEEPNFSALLLIAVQLIDIGFSLFMLFWMFHMRRTIDWTLFWQVAYFLLALGLLTMSAFGTTKVVQVFLSAAAALVFQFMFYFLTRLGRKSIYEPSFIVAIGYGIVSLIDWAVRASVAYALPNLDSPVLVPGFLFLILCTIVFLLPARSPGMQLLTAELHDVDTPQDIVDEKCKTLAIRHGLSERESEVMVLLCKGRSAPYIAETLYLSENTVKTYRKRIYQKLGIHDKQKLLDLVSGSSNS